MTAKEKAIELARKYQDLIFDMVDTSELDPDFHSTSIDAALIAVEEVRQEALSYDMATGKNREDYWQQVKAELEAL